MVLIFICNFERQKTILEERILLGSVARKYLSYLVSIHLGDPALTVRGRSRSGTASELLAGCNGLFIFRF